MGVTHALRGSVRIDLAPGYRVDTCTEAGDEIIRPGLRRHCRHGAGPLSGTESRSRLGGSVRSDDPVADAPIAAGARHQERVLVMTAHDHPQHPSTRLDPSDRLSRRSALGLGTTALGSAALLGAGPVPSLDAPAGGGPASEVPARSSPAGPSSPASGGIAANPVLVSDSDGPLTVFARTEDGRLISARRSAEGGADWPLQQHAVGIIGDVRAVRRVGRGLHAVARSEDRVVVVTETADGSDEFDVLVHEVLPEAEPALSQEGLFVIVGGAVHLLDPTTGELTEKGGPSDGAVSTEVEHRLHGTDAVTLANGPEGLVVVRRLEEEWSSFVADRGLSMPQLSTYSMRGGVTSWVAGLDGDSLIAGYLSNLGEETLEWQELDTGVRGRPAVSASMVVMNLFATVHDNGELHVTTLSPELRTRVVRTGAVGDPSLGALSSPASIVVHSLDADGGLWVSQLDSTVGEVESALIAEGVTGRATSTLDAQKREVFAIARTDGDLLVGTKTGAGVGDWELEVVDTRL